MNSLKESILCHGFYVSHELFLVIFKLEKVGEGNPKTIIGFLKLSDFQTPRHTVSI